VVPERDERDRPSPPQGALSVVALNELARALLERGAPRVWVEGEVADVTRSGAGHLYFVLGDGRAQVKCMMYRTDLTKVALGLAAGTRVQVKGGLTLYEPRGSYQLQVSEVIEAGLGARALELARLKKKLAAEGLLDPSRKRPLPPYPRTIGVVTSRDGAAWRDIVKVALDRFPARLVLVHAVVQGPEAPEQIVRALETIQHERFRSLSVILLARGGGASEDLAAFDDERVARAVASARVPIVTGVGHEIDVTLADLCADVRAATPSNAAERAVPSLPAIQRHIEAEERALQRAMDRRIDEARLVLERLTRSLADPRRLLRSPRARVLEAERTLERASRRRLADVRAELSRLNERLSRHEPRARLARDRAELSALERRLVPAMERLLERERRELLALTARTSPPLARRGERDRRTLESLSDRGTRALTAAITRARASLAGHARALDALSPLKVLDRGYAIATRADDGRAIRDAAEAPVGTRLVVRVSRGRFTAEVVDDDGE
jgi:exodeoxyribonuclease VII large subunit